MIYSEYGKTGKFVSRLGFGTNRFEAQYLQDESGMQQCAEVVIHAINCGINYFDTGHNYDNSKSEQILGLAFKNTKTPVYVSTKSSYNYDKTADDVLRRVESSLKAMNLSRISFYNMWGVMNNEHYRAIMGKGGPYEGLLKAKEAGMIDHICISTHASIDEILEIINDGFYEGITISFNAMTAAVLTPALKAAYKKNIAIISMNTLGGGLIPDMKEFFNDLLMPGDEDTAVAALRFNVSNKELTVALSGMGSIDVVNKNVHVLEDINNIGESRIKRVVVNDNPIFHSFCTGCGYCEPCPVDLPIKQLLFSYNYNFTPINGNSEKVTIKSRNFPLVFDKLRLELLKILYNGITNPCKHCGTCERKCTQKLPITDRIKEIFDNLEEHDKINNNLFKQFKRRPVFIWGSGCFGTQVLYLLHEINITVEAFIDSDIAKKGTTVESTPICAPTDLVAYTQVKPFVIIGVGIKYRDEIEHQLKTLGYRNLLDYI